MAQHPQSPILRQIQRLRHMRHLLASEDDLSPKTRVGFQKLQSRLAVQAAASKERNAQLLQAVEEAAGQQDSQSTVTVNMQLCVLRAAYMALVNRTLPNWCEAVADEIEQHSQQLDRHSYSPYAGWRAAQQQQQQCDIDHAQHSSHTNIAAGPQGVQVTPAVLEQLTQTLAEQSVLLQQMLQQQQQPQHCAVGVQAISCTAQSALPFTGAAPNTSGVGAGKEPKVQQQQPQAKALHLSVCGRDLFAPGTHQQQPTEQQQQQQQQQLKVEADEQACMPRTQALQNRATGCSHEQEQQQELQEQQQRTSQGDNSSPADASMLAKQPAVSQCRPPMQPEGHCRDISCSSNADKANLGHRTSTGQVVTSGDDPADAAAAELPGSPAPESNTMIASSLQQLDSTESSGAFLPSVMSPFQLSSSSSVVPYGEDYAPVHAEEPRQHVEAAERRSPSAISGSSRDLAKFQGSVVAAVQPAEHQGGAAAQGRVSAAVQVSSRPAAPPPAPPLPAQLPTAAKQQAETAAVAAAAAVSGPYMSIAAHPAANVCQGQQHASEVFAAAAAVAANTIAISAVQTCAHADTPVTLRSVADCAGTSTGIENHGTRQSANHTARAVGKSQQLGLGSLTAGLEVSSTAGAAAATPPAAEPTATRRSTSGSLTAGAAMRRTSSQRAVTVASASPSTSVAARLDSTGTTARGPLSIAHSVLLSPATRLSLGAAGHDVTSPSGRQSLSSESEVEGGSRRSIGAASTGSTGCAAVTRLAPALHVPADAVVPGGRKCEAFSRNLSRAACGGCSTASAAAVGSHLSVAGVVSQLQQQQAVAKGPLTVNAPKLRTAPLVASKLLGQQQQSDTALDPPQEPLPAQLQLASSSRAAGGATAVVDTQAQQVVAQSALAAEQHTNSTGLWATGGGISAQGHNVAAPSNAHLMSKVLNSGLTDFDGSDSEGDEGEVAAALTAGRAVGIMGKAASAFESDEFD